ncbi:hypothetical protein VTL71DRAFT_1434 [Oculimacula yallundae]|uniref:Uncharacterized protein n=1 Tax=Oculimacula yallundae TaxID=86028 RepID=A0ABR4CAQ5_9HELO
MRLESDPNLTTDSANDHAKWDPSQTVAGSSDFHHYLPQPSSSSLRHNVTFGGANVNMPTTYEKIQAYKPPAYVSPYENTQRPIPETKKIKTSSLSEPIAPRLPSKGAPPWKCCFSQTRIPEWNRHDEIWTPGTESACAAVGCQHKKCEDCLWQSLEASDGIQTRPRPFSRMANTKVTRTDSTGEDGDAPDEEAHSMTETPMIMGPPSVPSSRGINRDPRTGRARLWAKK